MFEIEEYFSIQIFFIILRETLETAIIISVLLSFINQRSHKHDDNSQGEEDSSAQRDASDLRPTASSASKMSNLANVQRKLKLQVWVGAIMGLVICFIIGLIFILAFYIIGKDYWSYTERVWEGVFSIASSVIITVMGLGLLRINKVMKLKWWIKLGDAYNDQQQDLDEEGESEIAKWGDSESEITREGVEDVDGASEESRNYGGTRVSSESESAPLAPSARKSSTLSSADAHRHHRHHQKRKGGLSKKYFLAILPLITTLREGLEAVVFIGGIGMSQPLTSIPLSISCGIAVGSSIGFLLYKGGNKLSLQYFLIFSTCFLYIVSAGLMSRGVWFLELESYVRACGGFDPSETGSGPGSYDVAKSVWHVNCCNGLTDGWWMVLNAIFGWTNSATYGSVTTYFTYWLLVIIWLKVKLYEERHGVLPFVPTKWQIKRIRKKIRLYELRNNQNLESLGDRERELNVESVEAQAEAQGLLE